VASAALASPRRPPLGATTRHAGTPTPPTPVVVTPRPPATCWLQVRRRQVAPLVLVPTAAGCCSACAAGVPPAWARWARPRGLRWLAQAAPLAPGRVVPVLPAAAAAGVVVVVVVVAAVVAAVVAVPVRLPPSPGVALQTNGCRLTPQAT